MNAPAHIATEQLSAYCDDMLTTDEAAAVTNHLATCSRCQIQLANIQIVQQELRSLAAVTPPRDFRLPIATPPYSTPQVTTTYWSVARLMSVAFLICGLIAITIGIVGVTAVATMPTYTASPSTQSSAVTPTGGLATKGSPAIVPTTTRSIVVVAPDKTAIIATATPIVPIATATTGNTYSPASPTLLGPLLILVFGILALGIGAILFVRLGR